MKAKRIIVVVVVGLLLMVGYTFLSFVLPPAIVPSAENFVLSNVTIVQPNQQPIEAGTIAAVGDTIRISVGDETIDGTLLEEYRGAYVLPGLIDMHTHLPPANALKLTPQFMLLYLMHGVTSLRGAGDVDGTGVAAARDGLADGSVVGPRIFSSGAFVAAKEARWPNTILLTSPDDAKDAVERLKKEGASNVKSYENLDVPMIRALEEAAEEAGLGVLGHVPDSLAYETALIADVQHFLGVPLPELLPKNDMLDRMANWESVDEARMDFIADVTLEHGIVNTPTLVSLHQLRFYENFEATKNGPRFNIVAGLLF